MKGEGKMKKLFNALAKTAPVCGVALAIANLAVNIVFGIHEMNAKAKYRDAKLQILRGDTNNNVAVDVIDECDVSNDE